MLTEISVENVALIEEATLELSPGLNAITGETGAGKTLLATALQMLLGGRARSETVRSGARRATVEGTFVLPDETRSAALAAALGNLSEEVEDGGDGVIREVEQVGARGMGAELHGMGVSPDAAQTRDEGRAGQRGTRHG